MAVKKQLGEWQLFELRDHRDHTASLLVKCYTPSQLSYMDGIDERTVKTSKKYLPVRVDSGPAMDRYRRGEQSKPYRVMYIRLDEIRALYNRRTGNRLDVEIVKQK